MDLRKVFTEHPNSVNETYFQHLKFALCAGFKMIFAGLCCVFHAFFPFAFKDTASTIVEDLNDKMENRGR